MSAQHTPGPWSLPHFAAPGVNCECGYVLTDHLMGAICTVHASGEGDDWVNGGDNPKFAQAVANARLIAAAPELLQATLALYALLATDARYEGGECMDLARAAILKATGVSA
jgi:hypothetical protein